VITATITTIVRRTTTVPMRDTTVLVHHTVTIFQHVSLRRTTSRQVKAPSAPRTTPSPRRRRRRHVTVISAISVLAVSGGAIVAYVLLHHTIPGATAQPIAASPDGKMLASADRHNIYVWNSTTGRVVATLSGPHAQDATNLAFSPDDSTLATATDLFNDTDIFLWDIATGRVVATLAAPSGLSFPAFSPNGRMLAAAGFDSEIYMWDVTKKRLIATLKTLPSKYTNSESSQITGVAFSPDGRTLAVSFQGDFYSSQPCGELWDIAAGRIATEFPSHSSSDGAAFSRDGRTVVIEESGTYLLWDVALKKARLTLNDPSTNAKEWAVAGDAAAYSPDGKALATADGSPNNSVFLWDVSTGRMTGRLTDPNSQGVGGLAYIQDGKTLAASDGDGNIYLWDAATGHIKATLTDPGS
jgi:WD40 repeat protein